MGADLSLIACSPHHQNHNSKTTKRNNPPFCGSAFMTDWNRERIEKQKFLKAQKTRKTKTDEMNVDIKTRRDRVSNGALITQSKRSKKRKQSRSRGKTQCAVPKDVDILSDEERVHRLNLMNTSSKSRFRHTRREGVCSIF